MQGKHHLCTQSILKTKHNRSTLLSSSSIEYNFPLLRIRYFISIAIKTHIDCLNNDKCSVRCIFKATKQGALKV